MIMASPRRLKPDPLQDELAFSSVAPHILFPNRTVLTVAEVAKALRFTIKHVCDLCDEGAIQCIDGAGLTNKSSAKARRIPVSAYDAFIKGRRNSTPES
jgi:hypothetical protein